MTCDKPASARMLWPGRDPLPVCTEHHSWAIKVAGAIGLYLGTVEPEHGDRCTQEVTEK